MVSGKPPIAAIILAAGRSSRMAPQNKLLAAMPDSGIMILHTVDNVAACRASPVIVVTGYQADKIRAALANRKINFVHADEFASGMAASLCAGIVALPEGIGAALICLGDMPLVTPAVIEKIIAVYNPEAGREIVVPVCDGRRGNPVLWGKRFFPALLGLTGDIGGKELLSTYKNFVAEIDVGDTAIFQDFDEPADFKTWRG